AALGLSWCLMSRHYPRQCPPGHLLRPQHRRTLLSTLAEVVTRYHWLCHAYCLMDNHYHLLLETSQGNLSAGMRQLNEVSPCVSIAATHGWGMFSRGASRRFSSNAIAICWSCVGMWYSSPCEQGWLCS